MIVLGIDLSLVSTGISVLSKDVLVHSCVVKSKPIGGRPIDEIIRLVTIVENIMKIVDKYAPQIVVIEGIAFGVQKTTALSQLAGLNYLVRAGLLTRSIRFVICAPTTLKRFITGKGNAPKDHVMMEVYKHYGITAFTNDIADAIVLSKIGAMMLGDSKSTVKYQKETTALLQKQI